MRKETECFGVLLKILMHDLARNMLARLDSEACFGHWKVTELVCSNQVVRLESGIESFYRPYSSNSPRSVKYDDFCRRIDIEVCLCIDQSMPAYAIVSYMRYLDKRNPYRRQRPQGQCAP